MVGVAFSLSNVRILFEYDIFLECLEVLRRQALIWGLVRANKITIVCRYEWTSSVAEAFRPLFTSS